MFRAAAKAVEHPFKEPVFTIFGVGVTDGRFDDCDFIWRQYTLAKVVLAVSLLEGAVAFDSHGGEQEQCVRTKDWCVFVRLCPDAVFMIAKHDNTSFGAVGPEHLVGRYGQDTHGRNSPRGPFSTEGTISCQVDDIVSVLRFDTILFFMKAE